MKKIKFITLIGSLILLNSCILQILGVGQDSPNINDPEYGELRIEKILLTSPDEQINIEATRIDDSNFKIIIPESPMEFPPWFLLSVSGVYSSLMIENESYGNFTSVLNDDDFDEDGYVDLSEYHFTKKVTTILNIVLKNSALSGLGDDKTKSFIVNIIVTE